MKSNSIYLSDAPSYLSDLSAAQREAVLFDDGPALVIAGAGSGKTRVLVAKLLHLLDSGYAPDRLMALTFTNKAGREMKNRVAEHIGYGMARRLRMGTFHSVFRSIISMHADLLGFRSDFVIYDSGDSQTLIKHCVRELDLDDKIYGARMVQSRISLAKNRLLSPLDYASNADIVRYDQQCRVPRVTDVYARYQAALRRNMAMDFDDLLYYTNILFRDHLDVRAYWQESIDYLLIDEYQDTNFAQYLIALQLMGEEGRIFAVGDDSQSIYSFRGANIENILHFKNSYPSMRLFKLEENYRSTRTIVEVAERLIAHNKNRIPKDVHSSKDKGDPIIVKACLSGDTEATWVASVIDEMHYRNHVAFDTFAVLYRTNSQSRILEQELRKRGIPFRIYGGLSFFSRREVKDVLAYLRLIVNPQDDEALLRCINYPKRGIGDMTVTKLRSAAAAAGHSLYDMISAEALLGRIEVNAGAKAKLSAFARLISQLQETSIRCDIAVYAEEIIRSTGLRDLFFNDKSIEGISRQENIKELLNGMAQYQSTRQEEGDEEATLASYLADIVLLTDQDVPDANGEEIHVTLMTIHSAKGLEFPHVFVVGLEEQLFPSSLCRTEAEIEEERRLLYVAITRAEQSCRISFASERFLNGHYERRAPSRFLQEIEGKGVEMDLPLGMHMSIRHAFQHGLSRADDYNSPPRPATRTSCGYDAQPRTMGGRRLRRISSISSAETEIASSPETLRIGMQVQHLRFGMGTITSIDGDGPDARADVMFDSVGQKTLLLRFARLIAVD